MITAVVIVDDNDNSTVVVGYVPIHESKYIVES